MHGKQGPLVIACASSVSVEYTAQFLNYLVSLELCSNDLGFRLCRKRSSTKGQQFLVGVDDPDPQRSTASRARSQAKFRIFPHTRPSALPVSFIYQLAIERFTMDFPLTDIRSAHTHLVRLTNHNYTAPNNSFIARRVGQLGYSPFTGQWHTSTYALSSSPSSALTDLDSQP